MSQPTPFYAIQPAFTGGEISGEVASRVDLEKYQLSLLQAENAIIRPYGPVYKRPGTIACGTTKYGDRDAILRRFEYSVELTYLLEIGDRYIRVLRDGDETMLKAELQTPFTLEDLKNLRFVQSVDVMYICSGRHPVQKLLRYSDTDWHISPVAWIRPAYGDINLDEEARIKPSGQTGEIQLIAEKDIFTADRVGDTMKIEQYVNTENISVQIYKGAATTTPNISAPAGMSYTLKKTGKGSCNVEVQALYERAWSGEDDDGYEEEWGRINQKAGDGEWALSGTITDNGNYTGVIHLYVKDISGGVVLTLSLSDGQSYEYKISEKYTYSASIPVGKTWKVITHGTWTGQIVIQQCNDGGKTWVNLRTYTATGDYNPTESGDVDEYSLLRIRARIESGTCNADLSAYPYRHEGYVTITGITNAKTARAKVTKALGGLEKTADWYWAAWSKTNGYPRCAAFFQDRLCFGGNKKYPQRLWMSRSGDYENFGIEKESGTVTDDSAVTADLLSRQAYTIHHMDVGNDLVVFTEGNMWTIAGGETVKPTNITPKNQENYGTNDVAPLRIGGRIVYVQRRGSIIRDTGYSYETDGYVGVDLTLLAKHLVRGREIVSAAYAQEPDSLLYFVRDDGVMLCLTYVVDQKVCAWSRFTTRGEYKEVCSVNSGNSDRVYVIVEREVNGHKIRCLEYFAPMSESTSQQDHVMMDAAMIVTNDTPKDSLPHSDLHVGEETVILADGMYYRRRLGGFDALPERVKRLTLGFPYTMTLEQPNWDAGNTDSGTVQGRKKTVTNTALRLTNSYGGKIGQSVKAMDEIIYDAERMEDGSDMLYTGDKKVVLPAGGWNTEGRTIITHDAPYPFSLSAIIREVSFGG